MRKKKLIRRLLILLCTLLVLIILYYINNRTIYRIEGKIKEKFNTVKSIEVSNTGPYCTLYVYLDSGDYEFEDIEPIFISLMLELDEEDNFNYFKERHIRSATGELAFLHIRFYIEKGKAENLLFEFSSYKDFEIWELEGNASVTYNVSDYTK